jgi:hypothetical protein
MKSNYNNHFIYKNLVFSTILFFLLLAGLTIPVFGNPDHYIFELIEDEVPVGNRIEFSVRIIHKETNEPVMDAMIFADRIDMTPDGKPDRSTELAALSSDTPGIYRYRANLVEAGNWQLTLMTMIPGAQGLVEGKMILKAVN